ncbi:MAG: UDP-N-acetylglucosamine--N-acetylmuramyl-(pentapeptide) pyrophosphoryl-undecaprenol, partial [Patescibacteria group bacterium]|nr:UDP-N-acetylglucosamine--N-acetylmuramyl-(pentapeptide) pyrophosphoryl-undecaprenol [Patescibacteria group bacterium]
LYSIYPDVVFGKGGYSSFPTIFAAKILKIPVIIHESDTAPGRVNMWAGKFAKRVAVSFIDAGVFFQKDKIAWTGHPIRTEIETKASHDKAFEYFKLESNLPVILILGGSQGAELINQTILDLLPMLIDNYQIIHQTGIKNYKGVVGRASVVLADNKNRSHYLPHAYLNPLAMKNAAGAANLIISRAGSTLFEIASWGVPSILIPFNNSNADHSRKNAFAYARAGACGVIEEANMTANILNSEIAKIMRDKVHYDRMAKNATAFYKPNAAQEIAEEIIRIAISHEE